MRVLRCRVGLPTRNERDAWRCGGGTSARKHCGVGDAFQIGWSNRNGLVSVNIKQKGQLMIAQLLKRRILPPFPESRYPQITHYVVLLIAAVILVSGFRL